MHHELSKSEQTRKRIAALDWMRGIVMVLMALDHASMFYNGGRLALDSAATYAPGTPLPAGQFLIRWITHICAPTFVFLAGTGLALSCQQRAQGGAESLVIDRDILARALVIASFDLVLMPLATGGRVVLQVMYAIGTAMSAMILLRRLPSTVLLCSALAWLTLGEVATTYWWNPATGPAGLLAALALAPLYSGRLTVLYPALPWLAVMVLGYVFGRYLATASPPSRRSPIALLFGLGGGLLAVFALVRWANGYGNMLLWRGDDSWVQWLHVSKYPPGLSYLSLELGLMCLALALLFAFERRLRPRPNNPLLVFGQSALFFYVMHIGLLAMPALSFGLGRAGTLSWAYGGMILVLLVLYPLCRRYRNYKLGHPHSWVRYL